MKANTIVLAMLVLACAAWAQTPAPPAKAPAEKPAAQPAGARRVISKPSPIKPADDERAKLRTRKLKDVAKNKKTAANTEPSTAGESKTQPEMARSAAPAGKRDPFVSPIIAKTNAAPCATGKKCLQIDQIMLRGTVRGPMGIIAVVENSARKAYFLRENDPVFNGYVVKITPDSVVFKETVTDRVGRTSQREVVKRVAVPSV